MKRGFTLIEMIAVLLIVGVLAFATAVALVPMAEGYLQVRDNADAAQSMAFATARLTREFSSITNVVSGTARAITYDHLDQDGLLRRRTLEWSGTPGTSMTLDDVPLLDDVGDLEFRYYTAPGQPAQAAWTGTSREIETSLRLVTDIHPCVLRIRPRNLRGN